MHHFSPMRAICLAHFIYPDLIRVKIMALLVFSICVNGDSTVYAYYRSFSGLHIQVYTHFVQQSYYTRHLACVSLNAFQPLHISQIWVRDRLCGLSVTVPGC
jgi:hypothetical protein